MTKLSDKELLEALEVKLGQTDKTVRPPLEERIAAGFEEIQQFVARHKRLPMPDAMGAIFERVYAVRLKCLRGRKECHDFLKESDHQNLLTPGSNEDISALDDKALLSALGVGLSNEDSITNLKHVKARSEVRISPEEIADRIPCKNFDKFRLLFIQVKKDLDSGVRETRRFQKNVEVEKGNFFIVGGQKAYVAEAGKLFKNNHHRMDRRLRVIYDNGTESNILLLSLQRALYKDEAGRRITDPVTLFKEENVERGKASGTIYVLRSLSKQSNIVKLNKALHKIGVTGGSVKKRIAKAQNDPTFLMADVEIVAEYKLYNINHTKLENIIHRVFERARLNIEIKDRFGKSIIPREWFLVTLDVIDDVVKKIKDKTIDLYVYDPNTARLKRIENIT